MVGVGSEGAFLEIGLILLSAGPHRLLLDLQALVVVVELGRLLVAEAGLHVGHLGVAEGLAD